MKAQFVNPLWENGQPRDRRLGIEVIPNIAGNKTAAGFAEPQIRRCSWGSVAKDSPHIIREFAEGKMIIHPGPKLQSYGLPGNV